MHSAGPRERAARPWDTVERVPPSLSVVIPVYNEPEWVPVAVGDLVTAVERSRFDDVELILVDDGSAEPTVAALGALATPFPHRVIRQENRGRFVARSVGLKAAAGDLVLLLDSRVSLDPDALAFVAGRLEDGEPLPIWNAHVEIELAGNPFARFWNVLTELAFRAYFDDPRTTSFGPDDFDAFPKGTTCFLAPREALLEAVGSFTSAYDDPRDANDDTILIRGLAARQRISISPSFGCRYRSRDALRPFLRHAFHRGGVFVDGYGRPGTRFFPVVVGFYPLSLSAVALVARRPRWSVAAGVAAGGLGGGAVALRRRSVRDGAVFAALGPLFAATFGAGMWRGLALAVRAGLARRG